MQSWRFLSILCITVVLGCAGMPPPAVATRPAWMENPQLKYPSKFYLTAVGEGDTLQTAETVAAGNLARIFRTDIVVDERLTERYYELIGKQNVYQEQSQLDRNISVYTAMSLQNVQYPERYTDKKTGRVYALATLNRAETAAIYVNRLKENDAMIVRFVQRSESPSPAMTYAALAAAVAISADSHQLRAQLDVLYPQAKSQVSTTYAHDVLQQRMATAAKQIGVAVSIENDPDGKVAQTIIAQLTGLGFVVAPGDAFLQVRGSVAMEETDLGSKGTFFVRYVMKLDMVDAYGKTVAALSEQGREGHISLNEAANRCTRSMTGAVERQLVNKVFNYFDRLLM